MIRIKAAITTACTVALVGVGALTGPLVAHSDDTVLGPDAGPDALAARIVAGMTNTSLVVMPDGRICGWGNPFTEQFGEWVNGVYSASTPTCFTLPGEVPATAISADMHAVALGADGVAYTWGGSIEGAVAYEVDDQPAYLPRPVAMPVTTRVTAVSAGFSHTAVLTEDGDIYMSGSNSYGQLGDGSESPSARGETSVKVTADDVAFTAISAGNKHTLAVSGEGRVYAWG
ncbi:MAG: hypothetical protein LBK72_08155, partial [Bifidobacteriaceae bacterium]|nr:hypothetical protein [Bifidobacteriaceae bacterium]